MCGKNNKYCIDNCMISFTMKETTANYRLQVNKDAG